MSTSNGLETPGLIDEYDVSSHEICRAHVPRRMPQSTEEVQQKLNYLSLANPMIAFCVKRGFEVNEFHPNKERRSKLKRILRFLRKRPTTNIRVAGSSRRVDRVHRQQLGWLQAHPEIHQWVGSSCTVRIFYSTIHGLKLVWPFRVLRSN